MVNRLAKPAYHGNKDQDWFSETDVSGLFLFLCYAATPNRPKLLFDKHSALLKQAEYVMSIAMLVLAIILLDITGAT